MDKLKIGDYVLVRDGTYSQVHSFGHYQPNRQIEFLKILTNDTATGMNEDPLEVSSDHLLYISTTNLAKNKREEKLVPAGDIKIGDCLISTNGGLARVVALHKTQARGLYSPLTTTGEIAVSGVLASNYVSRAWLKSRVSGDTLHLLQHGATTLHRVFCNWVIGNCQEEETHDEVTGFSPLVSFWYRLEQWQLRLGLIPRALFFTVLTPFAFCFILVGHIHVAPISALARYFSAALAGLLVWKMQNYKVKASKVPQVQH